jgi:hypothetical protein
MSHTVTFKINGKPVTAKQFRKHKMRKLARLPAGLMGTSAYSDDRPGKSLAMGCHTTEIGMMNERLRQEGIIGVEYVKGRHGGECRITNNSKHNGRRKWMKIYGSMVGLGQLHDEDSFD